MAGCGRVRAVMCVQFPSSAAGNQACMDALQVLSKVSDQGPVVEGGRELQGDGLLEAVYDMAKMGSCSMPRAVSWPQHPILGFD